MLNNFFILFFYFISFAMVIHAYFINFIPLQGFSEVITYK